MLFSIIGIIFLRVCFGELAVLNQTYHGHISNATETYVYNNQIIPKGTSIRVSLNSSDTTVSYPLFIIVRTQTNLNSFTLPLTMENRSFSRIENTICIMNYSFSHNVNFIVQLTTPPTFENSVTYSLRSSLENNTLTNSYFSNFTVMPNKPQTFIVSRMYQQTFVKIQSDDDYCAIALIQSETCSVSYDNFYNLNSRRQTFFKKAAFIVKDSDFNKNFDTVFVSILVFPTNKQCQSQSSMFQQMSHLYFATEKPPINKRISLTLTPQISVERYISAILATAGFFAIFYVIYFIWIAYRAKIRQSTDAVAGHVIDNNEPDAIPIVAPITFSADDYDLLSDANEEDLLFRMKGNVRVADLSRIPHAELSEKFNRFSKLLIVVAIFYGIPVVQLVLAYQMFYWQSGNEDICYENFWCQRPLWVFTSFNHIVSNMGYILLGFLFYLITYTKESEYNLQISTGQVRKCDGIPKHFGLFYSLGIAIMMEGLMSASYHVCPNWSNFQFDISFMIVIALLGMIRLYQSRHCDITLSAERAFLCLSILIFLSVSGVVFTQERMFWIVFTAIYLLTVIYVCCQIYYMGSCKIDRKLFQRIYFECRGFPSALFPHFPMRFFLLMVIFLMNITMAVCGIVFKPSFPTYFLMLFISNLILYFTFYVIMKRYSGEHVSLFCFLLLLSSIMFWLTAAYFFLSLQTNWMLSPAASRNLNADCFLLNFYDYHDIWHFLSAIALFLSFLVILILDDDLDHTPRTEIKVF